MVHYFSLDSSEQDMLNFLREVEESSDKYHEDIAIVCIGTDRTIYDAIGPLTGTFLKEMGVHNVYGTLAEPIHQLSYKKILPNINKRHKDDLVIAVDASIGHKPDRISIRDFPLKMGSYVTMKLPRVGDISILYCIAEDGKILEDIRLSKIYAGAKVLANILFKFIESYDTKKQLLYREV